MASLCFKFLVVVLVSIGGNLPLPGRSEEAMKKTDTEKAERNPSECAGRLSEFIAEIDQKIETSASVEPLRETIKKYFPLSGCNPDEAVSVARQSRYFDRADQFEKDVVIVLRKKTPGAWGFAVSFALSKETGESKMPNAMVDKTTSERKRNDPGHRCFPCQ